ncbi:MAG: sigma-54-dependent Fis family transcriptional regulator [Myxococcales bacterium FL481]|nr:MAG: sigma-54-dependent Fis family transcriptional regulator [Myxococcales bacterium FL481]
MKPKVLIVEDQPAVAEALGVLLDLHDIASAVAHSPQQARSQLADGGYAMVIQDMNFSPGEIDGADGSALFRSIRAQYPGLPVLVITAWTSLEMAVQLMREGARDYVAKPWDDARLLASVRSILELHPYLHGQREVAAPAGCDVAGSIVVSPAMQRVVHLACRVAASDVPVLITGPNGAGKEKIAEIIVANSPRRDKPFVRTNAGALPEALLEAELFGAEAGAYTGAGKRRVGRFEAAQGGTLLLDEIGNLSATGQMRLLRVLQTGEFERLGSSTTQRADVRVLAATNADLELAIADKSFREDLYYRLNVVELRVPALCERAEDILPLAQHFLANAAASGGPTSFDAGAQRALLAHSWPGNVRELQNVIRRAALLASQAQVRAEDLAIAMPINAPVADVGGAGPQGTVPATASRRAMPERSESRDRDRDPERLEVERALREANGVVARAADRLGLSRQALYRRMERLGIRLHRVPRS